MPIFAILSIISIVLYLYFKVKYFRSQRVMERQAYSAKSKIALGGFVLFYGINQLIIWDTQASTIIGIIFIVFGGFSAFAGFKSYRHYAPLVVKEAEGQLDTGK